MSKLNLTMWAFSSIRNWLRDESRLPTKRTFSVVLGFAGFLLLMGALVAESAWQWRSISSNGSALRKDYKQRDALMDELRTNAYRANTLLRDFLSDASVSATSAQRSELETLRRRSAAIAQQYQGMVLANEKGSAQDLSRHVQEYWQFLTQAFGSSKGEGHLREAAVPQRRELIKLFSTLNTINQHDRETEEERMQALQAQFQSRVVTLSLLAFLAAVSLAAGVVFHVRSLENDAARRFEELQATRLDLRRLSDRLVTAQEEERRSLSRELHDEVGQSMSAMLMELGRLESKLGEGETYHELFASIRGLAEGNVGKIRDLSLALRPAMLDELGLGPALRWQVREVSRRTGLKVSMSVEQAEDDLPDAYRTCIYRVVQEALHNCAKHSRASHVQVAMRREGDSLSISIEDNGVGFDAAHEKGLGLLGIAERVGQLGGQFEVASQPGRGTVASVHFPKVNI